MVTKKSYPNYKNNPNKGEQIIHHSNISEPYLWKLLTREGLYEDLHIVKERMKLTRRMEVPEGKKCV